ncbi:GNAT family acetyltransferase [Comamonas testosteroni]|uniref:GNAT family acetyltransferase n=2 Tax=Comamonas testosteroni TaxID=285 RepID=A0A0A8IE83_COMTE|nr:bifunctional GNAT family N-acetyltransferase/nucleoside diphosphate kinase regulator [Comamonas testosteroni]BAP91383.1 GNAT family acetyltransferase [Comamonas testosteroni]GEQ76065.1 GNAT family acetyltransferase [Comamonas testosteroni]
MSKPFISLCPEITRANAQHLVDWLNDEDVVRHLSDSRHVSRHIEQLIDRVRLPVLTHLFNQGGRFFMAYNRDDLPVGFVRLVRNGADCEIVLVIGNRDNWGRKLGVSALHEGMKLAFFDMRAERLIARIHADNTRSLKAFAHNGFVLEKETPALKSYAMTAQRYLQRLRTGLSGAAAGICITAVDQARLRDLLALEWESQAADLEHEIERACVIDARRVQGDVVTMNSRALLRLDEEAVEVALVYPEDADDSAGRLSVFSGVGTAILGCREGDRVDWRILDRTRHIRIEKLLYQPEAAGHFHL